MAGQVKIVLTVQRQVSLLLLQGLTVFLALENAARGHPEIFLS